MRNRALALFPFLLIGCDGEPVAPEPSVAPSFAATTAWVRDSVEVNYVYWDGVYTCVGEPFHVYGWVPYWRHEVANAAGGFSYHYQVRPVTPRTPQFSQTGLWSGTTWWYNNGHPINEAYRHHAGLGEVWQLNWKEAYRSDGSGTSPIQRLYSDAQGHLTVNAGGELGVYRWTYDGIECDKRGKR